MNLDSILIQASRYGRIEIVEQCLEHGADVHARDNTALRAAIYYGHTETLQLLKDYAYGKKSKIK